MMAPKQGGHPSNDEETIVPRPDNAAYYRRRMEHEQERAKTAALPEVRCIHREMASRYSAMIAQTPQQQQG